MERKAKGGGERDRDKRNGRPAPPLAITPAAPPSPTGPGDAPSSLLAAVRCARAALMLFSLRSPSATQTNQELRRDLAGAFATAAAADLDVVAVGMAGMTRQMVWLRRVLWIEAALQVLFVFVLSALFFLLLDLASPPPSGYYD